jgi:hypothetical protein
MAAGTARVPGAAEAEAAAAGRRGTFEGEPDGVAPLESDAVALGERMRARMLAIQQRFRPALPQC